MAPRYSSSLTQAPSWDGSISIKYRRRLATNSRRNPASDRLGDITRPRAAWLSLDVNIIGLPEAAVRLGRVLRRATQIALFPDESTRGSSRRSPLSLVPPMDSPDRARDIGKRARTRQIP